MERNIDAWLPYTLFVFIDIILYGSHIVDEQLQTVVVLNSRYPCVPTLFRLAKISVVLNMNDDDGVQGLLHMCYKHSNAINDCFVKTKNEGFFVFGFYVLYHNCLSNYRLCKFQRNRM